MDSGLVYITYVVAALGAVAVYAALPRDGQPSRRSLTLPMAALAVGGLVMLLGRLLGDSGRQIYFYILVVLALGGAIRVVTHPKPVYSALYFVLVVLSTAAMMVQVGAEFLGAALVIVYAGAILVTYVFVIMLAQQSHLGSVKQFSDVLDYDRNAREPFAAAVAGFVLAATVAGVIVGREGDKMASAIGTDGNTLAIGKVLLNDFAVSVELAGVLLMVAMIGAICIARKKLPQKQEGAAYMPGEIGRHVKPY